MWLCLLGALVGLTAASFAAEPARIGTVRFLRDGQVDKISFEYQGTLSYRTLQFPQAKYGMVEFEPAVFPENKADLKARGALLQGVAVRPMGGAHQGVRLRYTLGSWTAPTFHDTGDRFEIRFAPAPAASPAAKSLQPFDMANLPAAETLPTPGKGPAVFGGMSDDALFADYLKDDARHEAAAAPSVEPATLASLRVDNGSPAVSVRRAQGGEGVPPAEPTPVAPAAEMAPLTAVSTVTTTEAIKIWDVAPPAPTTGPAATLPELDILTPSKAFVPESLPGERERITGGRGFEFVDLTEEIFQKRISLTFKEADLQNAIRILARHADLNIVLDPRTAQGVLTVELNNVPVGAALASILRTNNLELIREAGGIYRVVPRAEVVRDPQVEEITVHIPLNWVPAPGVQAMLQGVIDGDIAADPIGNAVIITDTPLKIEEVANVIRRIDRPEKQVMLEARLVEMNTRLSRQIGISWDMARLDRDISNEALGPASIGEDTGLPIPFGTNPFSFDQRVNPTGGFDSLGVSLPANIVDGLRWAYGTDVKILGQWFQLSSLLELAEDINLAKVLVAPRVVTLNNQAASIQVLRRVPYLTTVIGAGGAQTITYSYEDIGVILSITPNITNNDYVRMKILPRQMILISQEGFARPTVDERQSETNVIVKDEETAIIAGLRQQDFALGKNAVPWVHDVPVLGWLFKGQNNRDDKTDLLAFVTPHIIKEAQLITEEERRRYDEIDINWNISDLFLTDKEINLNE